MSFINRTCRIFALTAVLAVGFSTMPGVASDADEKKMTKKAIEAINQLK